MRWSRRSRPLGALLALFLILQVAVPALVPSCLSGLAGPATAAAVVSDDEIPGNPLPMPPTVVTGALDEEEDWADIYNVTLSAGQIITVSLTSAAHDTDFDLALYAPGTESTEETMSVASSEGTTYPDILTYRVPQGAAGRYYLEVSGWLGTGSYQLRYEVRAAGPDDDVPGVPISGQASGTLDAFSDADDVYSIEATAGDKITAVFSPSAGIGDWYAVLYDPAAESVFTTYPVGFCESESSPEVLVYVVPRGSGGAFRLRLHAQEGAGAYAVSTTVAPAEADDDVPGVPLSAEATGTLDAYDPVDVYSVDLAAGQRISLEITGAEDTDFSAMLYSPGTTSLGDAEPCTAARGTDYPRTLVYTAPNPGGGTYALAVRAGSGGGSYRLAHTITDGQPDDNVRGVLAQVSPVTGSVDATLDMVDVYRVPMAEGSRFSFEMTTAAGMGCYAFLFSPETTDIFTGDPVELAFPYLGSATITYDVPAAEGGDYYLAVWNFSGSGDYRFTWSVDLTKPTISLTAPQDCAYGASTRVSGNLRAGSAGMVGKTVHLMSATTQGGVYTRVRSATTGAGGAYSFSMPAPSAKTYYRVVFTGGAGYDVAMSADTYVRPRVSLTVPAAPTTAGRGAAFTSAGYLKPRHTSGQYSTVLQVYRLSGTRWVYVKSVKARNANYSSYTRYSASMSLSTAGKYRIRAYHADAGHAPTYTGYRYVTVR